MRFGRLSGPAGPLIGAAAGLLVAVAVTLLQDSTYRADASIVLVRQGQPPGSDPQLSEAARAAAELFDSRAVAESAIRNLGLDDSPQRLLDRVDVEASEGSSLVRIDVEARSGEEARRTAQEVAEVATVLFNDRFAPQTTASVWEPASAAGERVSPKPARNLALGLLIGALAGFALVLAGLRERARRGPPGALRRRLPPRHPRRRSSSRLRFRTPLQPRGRSRSPPSASGPSPTSSGCWPSTETPSPSSARSSGSTSTRSAASPVRTGGFRATSIS